jgi:NAD(P)-dependent dehydrogenase (short-subunit alcohol dehydrogenase family)
MRGLYGMAKAAVQRIAGVVVAEAGHKGVLCFSLDTGFVKTAVVGAMPIFCSAERDIPATLPASAIAWLASSPDARALNGQMIRAEEFTRQHGLT